MAEENKPEEQKSPEHKIEQHNPSTHNIPEHKPEEHKVHEHKISEHKPAERKVEQKTPEHHHAEHRKKSIALYKKLLIIPMLLLVLSLAQIGYQMYSTGDFVKKDYSLTGGIEITAQTTQDINTVDLKQKLEQEFSTIADVRLLTQAGKTTGIIVTDSNAENQGKIKELLAKEIGVTNDQLSAKTVGPALAQSFFKQTIKIIVIAFIFMSIVVFFYFRVPIPSLAVILAAFSDIVLTLAVFNILGEKLSTAGIAAFIMLIGYSVDTDILLSARVLKRTEGTVEERIKGAMKTGLLMNFAALATIITALIISQSPAIKQIMLILMIGLFADMINTWIQNAAILRIYMEKKHNE